jgi:hypothetical protein
LCGDNAFACILYVVGACSSLLVGFTLILADRIRNLCDFGSHIRFGILDIVDFFIASCGNIGQSRAKRHHIVNSLLIGVRVGLVLAGDLESLVRALTKRIPDGIGGDTLLLSESGANGLLQSLIKIGVVAYGHVPVNDSVLKNLDCRSVYPLEANQKRRPFTGREVDHLHNCRIDLVATALASTTDRICGSELLNPF